MNVIKKMLIKRMIRKKANDIQAGVRRTYLGVAKGLQKKSSQKFRLS